MINFIDRLLNKITMYRLVLYVLIIILAAAIIFGALGWLPYSPVSVALSALIILIVCWAANETFAKIFKAQPNVESVYITALILTLIISPAKFAPLDWSSLGFLIWASIFAMASKYVLTINQKHIFNPAAIAVVLTAFLFGQYASWWVGGNLPLLGFVLVGGLLISRKIQRFDLVLAFGTAAFVTIVVTNLTFNPLTTIEKALIHTTLLFFAFVMLTEPSTTPPTRPLRIAYGALVGVLFAPAIHVGPIYSSPELALVAANIFSYLVSPKGKFVLELKEKKEVGMGIYDFAFSRPRGMAMQFNPGQYMEWTLGHQNSDSRGNRRYFTVASSPTEHELRLGVRFYERSSSFKKNLLAMEPGDTMMGGQLAGDFVLPKDKSRKLVFVAGGIGITPFRSMIKYLSDRRERRDVVLLYSNRTAHEIAYRDVFDEAARTIGLRTVYAATGMGETLPEKLPESADAHRGRIDEKLVMRTIPDYRERTFYISGTQAMVSGMEKMLRDMGIPQGQIKTDFFPGFA